MFSTERLSGDGDSPVNKKVTSAGGRRAAGDSESEPRVESLIPIRSRTADAMSERQPAAPALPLLLPLPAFAALIASIAGAAALAIFALLATILKRAKNGLFSLLVHLAVADLTLLITTIAPEIWTCNTRTWHFGIKGCIIYQGFNVFASTASTYFVAALSLHTLASINIERKAIERKNKKFRRKELQNSQHSLVENSDSSTPPRTINVDYRLTNMSVSVALPTVFVWVLAVSLSIPEFVLATATYLENGTVICTLDSNHIFNMYAILTVFNLLLPLFIMITVSALLIFKLVSKRRPLEIDTCESVAAIKLSLWFAAVQIMLCAPRTIDIAHSVLNSSSDITSTTAAMERFYQTDTRTLITLASSSACLLAIVIRPVLCIFILPLLRIIFLKGYSAVSAETV